MPELPTERSPPQLNIIGRATYRILCRAQHNLRVHMIVDTITARLNTLTMERRVAPSAAQRPSQILFEGCLPHIFDGFRNLARCLTLLISNNLVGRTA